MVFSLNAIFLDVGLDNVVALFDSRQLYIDTRHFCHAEVHEDIQKPTLLYQFFPPFGTCPSIDIEKNLKLLTTCTRAVGPVGQILTRSDLNFFASDPMSEAIFQ
jgi:hypothetical protein